MFLATYFTEQTSPFKERDDKLLYLHSLHPPPKKNNIENKQEKQLEMMSIGGNKEF